MQARREKTEIAAATFLYACGVSDGGEAPNPMLGLAGIDHFYLRLFDVRHGERRESMSELNKPPQLHFFRSTPKDLLSRPPLASSLQSFESCLFLIALRRYSHGFSTCVFAIEGAIKAAFGQPPHGRETLQKLLEKARGDSPQLGSFSRDELDDLRQARNRIVHYGFSADDDRNAATLLLRTGIPFLRACYKSFFEFVLDDGLQLEIGDHLRIAGEVFEKVRFRPDLDPRYCLLALGHLLRWSMKDSFMSHWEAEAANQADIHSHKFLLVEDYRAEVERVLDPSWTFDCPICNSVETFVCELDERDLEQRRISLLRSVCVECELVVPRDCPFLTDALCGRQAAEHRDQILHEFGIA